MPNWCNNSITISGPTETIQQLWEDAQAAEGLLEAMVPMPKELRDTVKGTGDELQTEKYDGATNWYDWAVNRWGTKWDVSLEGLEIEDNGDGTAYITGWFDSAWAPPIEAYNTFLEDMDNCSIEASYHEPGMDYAGFYNDGDDEYCENLTEQCELPYHKRSDLFNRLDDEYALVENYEMWKEDEEMED